MLPSELPKQIELLVDTLRKQKSDNLSLTDIASVTEVLIGTMQAFFRSIDTSLYRECRSLGEYITNARREIASLQPHDLEDARIPRAGLELDAIVQHTETATDTIMTAAEKIMGLEVGDDIEAYQAAVQDNILEIFEACSFQDITGQRISKVVETLAHIEARVAELRSLFGVTEAEIHQAATENSEEIDEDKALLRGPALEGEGIDQSEIDALLGGTPETPAVKTEAPSIQAEPPPQNSAEQKQAAPKPAPPKPAAPKPDPPKPAQPKSVSPKKLDAMFQEDFDPAAEMAKKQAARRGESGPSDTGPTTTTGPTATGTSTATSAPAPAKSSADTDTAMDNMKSGEDVSQDDIDALFN